MNESYPTPSLQWIIAITVMLVTIMEILDMTIVTVALPPMMGQLSANSDQITWVLTSYIVSSAIIMPLTGFFVSIFGRKTYMIIMIIGFMLASMLCGLSQNLIEIVIFRMLQGIFGASLVPMSQYILKDTFPPKQQGLAMAVWGMGIMVAPVLGPTLGGYITHHFSWRWVFYINVPFCLVALIMTWQFIKDTTRQTIQIDSLAILLMIIGVGGLQIFLDRGNSNQWLQSHSMQVLAIAWITALTLFIIRGISRPNYIINLALFKNRNFTISTLLLASFSLSIFALLTLQPLMLEHLLGYSAQTAGLSMLPRGIAAAIGMALVAKLINHIDVRWIIITGIATSAYGAYLMSHLTLHASFSIIAWQGAIQGFGMGLFFVPVGTCSLSTLAPQATAQAAGLFSFGRNLGSSIGISIFSTIVSRHSQLHWHYLGEHINASNIATKRWLQAAQHHLSGNHSLAILTQQLFSQSSMMAFLDAFSAIAMIMALIIPLVFLLQKTSLKQAQ